MLETLTNNNQKGSVGVVAIIAMMLLGIIGAAYIAITSSEASTAANFRNGIAAQYLAEAGIQHAFVKLKSDPTFTGSLISASDKNPGTATAGRYSVSVSKQGNKIKIVSIGTVANSKREIVVIVTPPAGSGVSQDIFSKPLFANANISVNHSNISGNIGSNANIDIDNGVSVDGNLEAHGTYSVHTKSYVSGTKTSGVELKVTPSISVSDYQTASSYTNTVNQSSVILQPGIHKVSGNMRINQSTVAVQTGSATIFVDGNLDINQANVAGNMTFVVTGTVTLNQSTVTGLVVATDSITINHVNFVGTAVSCNGGITVNQSSVTYSTSIVQSGLTANSQLSLGGNGTAFTIDSWGNH